MQPTSLTGQGGNQEEGRSAVLLGSVVSSISPREGKLEQGKSLPGTRATHSLAFLSHQPILCLREQVLSQRWPVLGRTGSKTRGWLLPQTGNPCLKYETLQLRQSLEFSFPSGKRKEAEPHKGSGVAKAHQKRPPSGSGQGPGVSGEAMTREKCFLFLIGKCHFFFFFLQSQGERRHFAATGGERGGRGDSLRAAMWTLLVGMRQPRAHWALSSLPVPTWPSDAKNQLIGKDPDAGKD